MKLVNLEIKTFLSCVVAGMLLGGPAHAQHFEYKEHHLGPTGLFGVTSKKDITIVTVDPGSPADGRIKAGDVIVGAGGTLFKDTTRQQLADAIDQAETEQSKGVLTLTLADGRKVDLQLKVLGSYSDTAPLNCKKTDAIITQAADWLVKSGNYGRDDMPIGLLGLLATGEPKYIEAVSKVLHEAKWAKPDLSLTLDSYQRTTWSWGYLTMILAEYYLLTGDDYVLPALKTYAVTVAKGRDAGGLWGHGMATLDNNNGQWHGRLPGYSHMNQSSLPCFISVLLADKCGIKDPEIKACIEQTHGFYTDFIHRGTPAYGVHEPKWNSYNNNGMSGLAAVAFSVHGNKEGAAFFSRMSAAAHNIMETGHTGHYFNQLWTGLGANLAGPETTAAFFEETRWLHTLNRNWDGNFTYDCCGYKEPEYSYRGLSDAGSHLLNYCLGRRKLFITGRNADESIWLKGREVDETIALATMDLQTKKDEELLAFFGHPMPKVRGESVNALRNRDHKLLPDIRKMLREGSPFERESAVSYFGNGCPEEQALAAKEELAAIMNDPAADVQLRATAVAALCQLKAEAFPYYNGMLGVLLLEKPKDPRGMIDMQLGNSLNALSTNPYADGLVTDKDLFYSAVEKLLDHKRAQARGPGTQLILNIPIEDFHRVADKISYLIDDKDLTYHSYHNLTARTNSLMIFANLRIKGGIEAAFAIFDSPLGKHGFKVRLLNQVVPKYGAGAKYFLPRLKEMNLSGVHQGGLNAMIESIEKAEGSTEVITFDQAKQAGMNSKTNKTQP